MPVLGPVCLAGLRARTFEVDLDPSTYVATVLFPPRGPACPPPPLQRGVSFGPCMPAQGLQQTPFLTGTWANSSYGRRRSPHRVETNLRVPPCHLTCTPAEMEPSILGGQGAEKTLRGGKKTQPKVRSTNSKCTAKKQAKLEAKVAEYVLQTNSGCDMKIPMSIIMETIRLHSKS